MVLGRYLMAEYLDPLGYSVPKPSYLGYYDLNHIIRTRTVGIQRQSPHDVAPGSSAFGAAGLRGLSCNLRLLVGPAGGLRKMRNICEARSKIQGWGYEDGLPHRILVMLFVYMSTGYEDQERALSLGDPKTRMIMKQNMSPIGGAGIFWGYLVVTRW